MSKHGVTDILHDDRPISSISWGEESWQCYVVGHGGISKIEAYGEPSHYSSLPWFAIYMGDEIIARLCAHNGCHVQYKISKGGTG